MTVIAIATRPTPTGQRTNDQTPEPAPPSDPSPIDPPATITRQPHHQHHLDGRGEREREAQALPKARSSSTP